MALIEFDTKNNEWYRTIRCFMAAPVGEPKQSRYKTLEEAVRLNPDLPVRNPETGEVRSMRFHSIGNDKTMLVTVPDDVIESAFDANTEE
jgi:hypothetical protein